MKNPLLSILIATKNRVPYCINTIETILKFKNTNFELIIQDNTDTFELKDYIKSKIKDDRLIYNYTPPPFSSIDNFNTAIGLSNGKYVCLIGDDDGISSTIFAVVEWAQKSRVDSVCPKVFSDFYWPNAFYQGSKGYVTIPYFSSSVSKVNPKERIQDLLEDGIVDYMKFNLPKLYHGLIKKSCLDEIKNKNGYYLGGLSPDIYSSITLSYFVKNHIVLDFPITIAGACKSSTTVAGLNGGHSGILSEAPHFRDRESYKWDSRIPKYYSVQTIWAESAFRAIIDLNLPVNLAKFNLAKLVAKSLTSTPYHLKLFLNETNKALNNNVLNKFYFYLKVLFNFFSIVLLKYLSKIINKIKNKFIFKSMSIYNVNNIEIATNKIEILIKNQIKLP